MYILMKGFPSLPGLEKYQYSIKLDKNKIMAITTECFLKQYFSVSIFSKL